jgi:hypothetical protein
MASMIAKKSSQHPPKEGFKIQDPKTRGELALLFFTAASVERNKF